MNETRTIGTVFLEPSELPDIFKKLLDRSETNLDFLADRYDLRHNHGMNQKAFKLKVTVTLED